MLAETGRAVVVTIHQPRSEIFHSFDKILLLCRGQVAFFGSPIKVWDFFTRALNYEDESLVSQVEEGEGLHVSTALNIHVIFDKHKMIVDSSTNVYT